MYVIKVSHLWKSGTLRFRLSELCKGTLCTSHLRSCRMTGALQILQRIWLPRIYKPCCQNMIDWTRLCESGSCCLFSVWTRRSLRPLRLSSRYEISAFYSFMLHLFLLAVWNVVIDFMLGKFLRSSVLWEVYALCSVFWCVQETYMMYMNNTGCCEYLFECKWKHCLKFVPVQTQF